MHKTFTRILKEKKRPQVVNIIFANPIVYPFRRHNFARYLKFEIPTHSLPTCGYFSVVLFWRVTCIWVDLSVTLCVLPLLLFVLVLFLCVWKMTPYMCTLYTLFCGFVECMLLFS